MTNTGRDDTCDFEEWNIKDDKHNFMLDYVD